MVTRDVAAIGGRAEAGLVVVIGKHNIFWFRWSFHENGEKGEEIYLKMKLKGVDRLMGIALFKQNEGKGEKQRLLSVCSLYFFFFFSTSWPILEWNSN